MGLQLGDLRRLALLKQRLLLELLPQLQLRLLLLLQLLNALLQPMLLLRVPQLPIVPPRPLQQLPLLILF